MKSKAGGNAYKNKPKHAFKKRVMTAICALALVSPLATPLTATTAHAMPTPANLPTTHGASAVGTGQHQVHSFNSGAGRTGPITENDFHTPNWDRFGPMNYWFNTGPNWNAIFGQSTSTQHFTPDNTFSNIRRDRHVARLPPTHGTFSSIVRTDMVNPMFQQSVHQTNQQQPFIIQSPQIHSFLNHGAPHGGQANFTGQGSAWGQGSNTGAAITQTNSGMMTPTSIIGMQGR